MKISKLLITLLLLAEITSSQNSEDLVIAKKNKITSTILGEERTIYISTPSGYDKSKDSYPVFYIIDGVTDVIGLVKYITDYIACPQMIIVSINAVNSTRDMFPSKPKFSRGSQPTKPWYNLKEDNTLTSYRPNEKVGEADNYLSFIEKEVIPYIDKNYRTVPFRIGCGHSKGGLCVTYAFLSRTNLFNAYIALNPALYWDDGLVMKNAEERLSGLNFKHRLFYFNIGGDEVPSTIGDAFTFAQVIGKNASQDLRWKLDYLPNESHASGTALGIINALKFFYEGWGFDLQKIKTQGFSAIDSFYNVQSEKYGYKISYGAGLLNGYGWGYIRNGKAEESIKIFNENVRRFPDSPDAYNYLGEGYLAAGNFEMAIKSYEKAIELATNFKNGNVEFLKRRLEIIKTDKK